MGTFEPRRFPGLPELYFAGRRSTPAAKPAKDSNRQPGLFHNKCCADRGLVGRSGIRRTARQDLSGGAASTRLRALPGVESAAFARVTPLGYGTYSSTPIAVDGYQPPLEEQPTVDYNQVSPDYFATLGIPLLSGREFTRADDENAALVAIVNQTMAARYWRGQNPIDRRLQVKGRWVRVIGVAADSKYESMRESPKAIFLCAASAGFRTRTCLVYPHRPTSAEHLGGPAPRSARTGPGPRPLRGDYTSGTSQSLDLAATCGRNPGFDLRRIGASSGCRRPVWRDVLCRSTSERASWACAWLLAPAQPICFAGSFRAACD